MMDFIRRGLILLGCLLATWSVAEDVVVPTESNSKWLPNVDNLTFGNAELRAAAAADPTLDRSEGLPFFALPGVETRRSTADKVAAKKIEPVVAPIPAYNPTFGLTVGVVGGLIYTPDVAGETHSPWVTGIGGFYSETESWGAGVAHKMNLADDRWRMLAAFAHADLHYDFYGIGDDAGNSGIKVPIAQDASVGLVEVMRETLPNLYVGLRYLYSNTSVGLDGAGLPLPPGTSLDKLRLNLDLAAVALRLQYDTRDSEFYPTKGVLADGTAYFYDEALGGELTYQSYTLSGNWFWSPVPNHVVATRVVGKTVQGDAPFFALPAFGSQNDLRGYIAGKYRDKWLVAGQVEYRLRFWQRFGFVAFAGVGSVAPEINEFDKALPSVGCGLRYVLAKQNNVSFRFDVAWGRDDVAFYFGVGEAF